MNLRKYIIIIGLLLAAWITPVLAQDYVAIVCAGDTGRSYYVQGTEGSTFNWTVSGGIISRNYGDSIVVDWGDVPGVYQLSVQEVSEYGCNSVPRVGNVLVSAPLIDLGDDAYICEGETFTLAPEGDFYSFEWSDGTIAPYFRTSEEGLITCIVSDQYGCFWQDEIYLEVKPLPEVDLGRDTSLCGEQSLFLSAGTDGVNYVWSTGQNTPDIYVYQGYQEVWALVEDEFGCQDGDTIIINDCDTEQYFSNIPNAITPSNPDGVNDYWEIRKLQDYPDAVVDIYDRWGRLIWRSEPGYPSPWDGRNMNGKEVPMDSYQYIILLNFGNDERIIGTVTVIR